MLIETTATEESLTPSHYRSDWELRKEDRANGDERFFVGR
jgi:hypothetical protein